MTIINYNFCYSQQVDKDIEILKKEIIGTWVSTIIDTTGFNTKYYYTEKHTFTAKKYTVQRICGKNKIKTKTIKYYFKRTFIEEIGKDIITLVFVGNKKLTSYEYLSPCLDKNLKDFNFQDWQDIIIKNNIMSFFYDTSKLSDRDVLKKE